MTTTVVVKFGGAAMSSVERVQQAAALIVEELREVSRLVVVVSAMGTMTDDLLGLARKVNPQPPGRELDMLLTAGERISMALLAMALAGHGVHAISLTGSQSGIITSPDHSEARIIDVRPQRILEALSRKEVVVVAGFQGVSSKKEVTTLGRGGSDTSAVALGIALQVDHVKFYKDVPGICDRDPNLFPEQHTLYPNLTYDEVLQILSLGGRILHQRSVLLAKKNNLPLHVVSFRSQAFMTPAEGRFRGTIVHDPHRERRWIGYEGETAQAD